MELQAYCKRRHAMPRGSHLSIRRLRSTDYVHTAGVDGESNRGIKMWTDPIVEEIRREREAYAAKFNFDIEAICRDLQRQEQEIGREIVTLPLKRRTAEAEKKHLQTAQGG